MKLLVNGGLLVLFLLSANGATAQIQIQEFTFAKLVAQRTATNTTTNTTTTKPAKKIAAYYRQHEKLPTQFSGLAIELTTSDLPLRRDYFLFKRFGNVYYHRLTAGGYSYCILPNFSSKKAVEHFLETVVIHRAPEAKLIKYKKGKRKD
ncbi:MAG: hypothetical protein AB8G15_08930 [Saprospiraceae bacterium]